MSQPDAMPHAYTEDQLVEQPAIGLFAELVWKIVFVRQIQNLRRTRDLLLPRLLSGQINLGEIEL
jgi:hypothetical protein